MWCEHHSFVPLDKELVVSSASLTTTSKITASLASTRALLRAVNKNSRKIFRLIIEHRLQAGNDGTGEFFCFFFCFLGGWFVNSFDLNHYYFYLLLLFFGGLTLGLCSKTEMAFGSLYDECRNEFLVSSEAALRSHLTEFCDHQIIQLVGNRIKVLLPSNALNHLRDETPE
jgi:hypothetical protein